MIQDTGCEMQEEIKRKKRIIHVQINLNENEYKIISHKGHKDRKKLKYMTVVVCKRWINEV